MSWRSIAVRIVSQRPAVVLEIGQPSLRWRVTDKAAGITHLVPGHPLMSTSNGIGPIGLDRLVLETRAFFREILG